MYTINMDRERANTKRMIRKKVISPEKDLRYLLPLLESPVSAISHTPFFGFTKSYAFNILPSGSISFDSILNNTFERVYFSYYNEENHYQELYYGET
jgi:hypothetical protein